MIELTRLNGTPILLNSDLIKTAESSPDTMLTLINGEKLIVRENLHDIMERTLVYRAELLSYVTQRLSPSDPRSQAASIASLDLNDSRHGRPQSQR